MNKFFKNLIGNMNKAGQLNHSLKKVLFFVVILITIFGPHILLYIEKIDGQQWLDFYMWMLAIAGGYYNIGKVIDWKTNGNNKTVDTEEE